MAGRSVSPTANHSTNPDGNQPSFPAGPSPIPSSRTSSKSPPSSGPIPSHSTASGGLPYIAYHHASDNGASPLCGGHGHRRTLRDVLTISALAQNGRFDPV